MTEHTLHDLDTDDTDDARGENERIAWGEHFDHDPNVDDDVVAFEVFRHDLNTSPPVVATERLTLDDIPF